MIRGYFVTSGGHSRPFVNAGLASATGGWRLHVPLLVDTGADRTVLAPIDAWRAGIDLSALSYGRPSSGVGGPVPTRTVDAVLTMQGYSTPLRVAVLEWPPPPAPVPTIHSVLGRDIISRFMLVVEERTGRVLLLEPHEADSLSVP